MCTTSLCSKKNCLYSTGQSSRLFSGLFQGLMNTQLCFFNWLITLMCLLKKLIHVKIIMPWGFHG